MSRAANMEKPLISVKKAGISFLNVPVLTNVNIEIYRAQCWAIVGRAGSGKTSLLNAIAGNIQLHKGEINRYFTPAENTVNFHQMIAYVASRHHFRNLSNTADFYYQQRYNSSDSEDALTVNDYLKSINTPHPSAYWDFDKVVTLLRLTTLADKQLIKLSNGETKRLMIAAALLKNPLLLLLDNPLTGLDVETRAQFNEIISKIASAGITIVIATSPHEIPDAVTHVAILQNQQVSITTKDQFKTDYSDLEEQPALQFDLSGLLDRYPVPDYRHIVAMQNVNVKYGDKTILNNVDWHINQGEHWALMGPNGAGKSTLLSLINGDNPQAYANDITLFDKKRGTGESIWDIKKKTGFISPELYQYFPADSSCLHTIESGYYDTIGLFRPSDQAKAEKALKWMQVLGIDQYARQLLKNIPASAQRLCLLARAMVKCPTLLILDEPCQGMDDRQIAHFKALVDTICQQTNITLIYVTHYQEHIPDSVTRVLKLANGYVVD